MTRPSDSVPRIVLIAAMGVLATAACNAIVGVDDLPFPLDATTAADAALNETPDAAPDAQTEANDADAESPIIDGATPQDSGADGTTPQDAGTDGTTPQDAGTDGAVPQDSGPDGNTPVDAGPDATPPRDSGDDGSAPEDAATDGSAALSDGDDEATEPLDDAAPDD